MITCTEQHLNFNEELYKLKDKFPVSNGLCPQIGQEVTVKGKRSSDIYIQLAIKIKRCDTTDPTCANDTVFSQ